ncbi:hypothetical protein P879_02646, partial [Paragonimus westermani]
CEVPANSYVEFIRVIWPGGLTPVKQNEAHFYAPTQNEDSSVPAATTRLRSESGVHNSIWDIFHQSVISQKRNVTEIVARFREDLVKASHSGKHSSATEVYKLLFRVARPPVGAPGRVAPRILWSLVSLSRQNTPDRTVLDSPIVTRLNIESSELKHLAIVIKTSALVNLAALTGQPTRHPVWVYGLTHNAQLIDVTSRATCHTGDDAIIHFANDACTKLGFSGAELDGSPGLPLVAKLDGRSATATLLVWFPKAPALRLAVGSIIQNAEDLAGGNIKRVKLNRIKTEITNLKHDVDKLSVWDTADDRDRFSQSGMHQFQHLPVRVLARFILAGSVLYDKDVLGGKIDQYVDVTEFTAHRLRLKSTYIVPADSRVDALTSPMNTEFPVKLVISKNSGVRSLDSLNGTTEDVIQGLTAPNMAWLVGVKPGLVRILLEPIDQSVTNTHIPPGLAKQLKDQRAQMMAHNGSGLDTDNRPLLINAMDDAPSLEVHVTEEDSIWPVGLSAQLIFDFQMVLHQNVDPTLARDNPTSLHGPVLHAAEDLMPLYSSLHAIQFTPIGGQLVHSGTVHDYFTRKDAQIFYRWKPLQPVSDKDHINDTMTSPHDPQLGYLLVWIHLSDGSTILWNRMAELYQIIRKPLPFKLVVENLRSDVFRLGESISKLRRRRRRRSASGWSNGATGYSWMNGMPTEGETWGARSSSRDDLQYDDNLAKPPESRHSSWFGPTVKVLPNSLPFAGAIKEDVKGAVPIAKRPDQPWLHGGQEKIASLLGVVKAPLSVQPRTHDATHQQYHVPPLQFSPNRKNIIGDINHELIALKDAPGFRSISSATSNQAKIDGKSVESHSANPNQPGALDETSLSDQTRDDKLSMGFTDLRHGSHDLPVSDQEAVRGSRTALELSMYILLGLFALVGLVFAVNCGAVIARYRWERMGRRRDSQIGIAKDDRTSETLKSRSRPASEDAAKNTLCVSSSSEMEPTVEETGVQSLVKRCKQILLPNRTKHKPLLHRDDDWVWISRDKAATSMAQLSSDRVTCLHSPTSPPLTTNRTPKNNTISREGKFSRSHSYGGKRTSTTAVLSIGEADMLLMHSPYRRSAWRENYQSDEAGETSDYSPSITNSALLYQDDGRSIDPWVVAHCGQQQPPESHSAGRPPRRHTTGALMQRNYQGQECSIRIISNPMSDQNHNSKWNTSKHVEFNSRSNAVVRNPVNSPNICMGSASASMRRRQQVNLTSTESIYQAPIANYCLRTDWNNQAMKYLMLPSPYPAPTQPAPPVPTSHLSFPSSDLCWEAVMYRSWIRPRTVCLKLPNSVLNSSPNTAHCNSSTRKHCCDQPDEITSTTALSVCHTRKSSRTQRAQQCFYPNSLNGHGCQDQSYNENFLGGLCEDTETDGCENADKTSVPCPPMRTTSRTNTEIHTIESHKPSRRENFVHGHRPLSLPQNFHALGGLYSTLPQIDDSIETSTAIVPHSSTVPEEGDGQHHDRQLLTSNPSEESLWWFHPVRQQRRRRRHHDAVEKAERNLTSGPVHSSDRDGGVGEKAHSRETIEYACPALCACDPKTMHVDQRTTDPPQLRSLHNSPVQAPPEAIAASSPPCKLTHTKLSTVTSTSDLAWDRELLALSHDRLMAYFADMKESTA